MTTVRHSRLLTGLAPAVLVIFAAAIAFYKISVLGYTLDAVVQSESYYIETVLEFVGHGSPVDISLALPQNLASQTVRDESFSSEDLRFDVTVDHDNRRGHWHSDAVSGRRQLGYTATVLTKSRRFTIDSTLTTTQEIPATVTRSLLADSAIQSGSPEITRLADSLSLSADSSMLWNVTTIFNYVTHTLKYVRYSGTTDALTAYHLNEASCGGKSRLMVALARTLGIPGRLVGGKILQTGQSKATHIWVELYIHGYWVPFGPTNNHFAEIPSNYLILYYGEQPAITHTKDINFKYFFNVKKRLVSSAASLEKLKYHALDILNVWATFKRAAISLELLKIIIMLPIGVLVVVLARNLIGVETFGTFMPALIAIGFRDTGLTYGIALFGAILAFGSLVRLSLTRFQLLHTPRLAIILSFVVLFLLAMTVVGVNSGLLNLARVALFPMVILTLTVERFAIIAEEYSFVQALRVSALTMMVASAAYSLMAWRFLQSVVIAFPETILLVIALHIYIGRYTGFRLSEFLRFKHLMVKT